MGPSLAFSSTSAPSLNRLTCDSHTAQLWIAPQGAIGREILSDLRQQIPLIIYTLLALFTRLYRIGASPTVVWDEVRRAFGLPPQRQLF